jgi:hypothetical protein
MGSHHPATHFMEAILSPNAVIVAGSGHTGPDWEASLPGSGQMPS